jgi:hypothetical protein
MIFAKNIINLRVFTLKYLIFKIITVKTSYLSHEKNNPLFSDSSDGRERDSQCAYARRSAQPSKDNHGITTHQKPKRFNTKTSKYVHRR